MLHFGWFCNMGFGVYGWNQQWSGNVPYDVAKPALFIATAQALENAGFDYLIFEDAPLLPDVHGGSFEHALTQGVVRHDPMPLMPLIARDTKHIGLVATMSASFYPPYIAARLFNTLDHLTEGRIGVNVVTSSPHAAAQNFGYERHFEHDLRYEMANEWIEAVLALWATWDEDSLVTDPSTGVFADHNKVHYADFEGKFFKTRGPLNTVPSPQRRPVICQAGGSGPGRDLAATHADTVIAAVPGVEAMKAYRDDMSARMIARGRKPEDVKVLFLVSPVLADTDDDAERKRARMLAAERDDLSGNLSALSYTSGIDFSKFDLDAPFPDLTGRVNGHQSVVAAFSKLGETKTLREVMLARRDAESVALVGSPATVAAQMDEVMQEVGGDGYLISLPVTRKNVAEVADGLAPALRRRGVLRTSYTHAKFRDNLLEY